MKSRILWAAIMVAAIVGFYVATIRPAMTPTAPRINERLLRDLRPPEFAMPPLPAPVIVTPTLSLPALPAVVAPTVSRLETRQPMVMEVPIQDGATIDFSIGAPVIRTQGDDQAALDRAVREMLEATKDVKFEPKK